MSRYFPKEGNENEGLQARSSFVNKQSVSTWFGDRGIRLPFDAIMFWSLCVMKRLSIMDMWIHCVSQAMANLLTFWTWRLIHDPLAEWWLKIQEHDSWPGWTNGQFWTLTTEHRHWFVWELHPHIDLKIVSHCITVKIFNCPFSRDDFVIINLAAQFWPFSPRVHWRFRRFR